MRGIFEIASLCRSIAIHNGIDNTNKTLVIFTLPRVDRAYSLEKPSPATRHSRPTLRKREGEIGITQLQTEYRKFKKRKRRTDHKCRGGEVNRRLASCSIQR
jgi:hypothetical protein